MLNHKQMFRKISLKKISQLLNHKQTKKD